MVTVYSVQEKSPAALAGIKPGDVIVSVNGNDINDILDYRFYITDKKLTIKIHRGAELFDVKIAKSEYDDIGIDFETYLMDKQHSCRNKCIFCFIDQLPKGMRDTLYFKDDDSRMSFLSGSYITLTNLSDTDIDRIIKFKTSPINISVQASNPELRCKMLNNRFAGDSLRYMQRLADAGIQMNCQIVLCKGVNDKAELDRTMSYLSQFYPNVPSVSIVPAGLTDHRENLYFLEPFSSDECREVINQVESFALKCKEKYGSSIFYCGDELYIKAGISLPDGEYYEDYAQIENGVGAMRSFLDEFDEELKFSDDYDLKKPRFISLATGESAYEYMKYMLTEIQKLCENFKFNIYKIENNFFGKNITVAGLLTGIDIYTQLKDKELGEKLFLPITALRYEKDMFLDNMTVRELEEKLKVDIVFTKGEGYDFISSVLF